jgi:alkylation response protein AidB-like acyl-CoA dehydrogenase
MLDGHGDSEQPGVGHGAPQLAVAAKVVGVLERMYRSLIILTFGGGTNELQRDLIAAFGMGMPMAKR